ncbi:MAG: Do family serine endopeptidase [Myxococcales bacterium]|nr:Do family serine endopeptidase [Polyangiaceae bacterium]MDW8248200.1 Do family serine endopeptidase [Myxococcales bacterium]
MEATNKPWTGQAERRWAGWVLAGAWLAGCMAPGRGPQTPPSTEAITASAEPCRNDAPPAPPPVSTFVAPLVNPVTIPTPVTDVAALAQRLMPTVVNITTSHISRGNPHEGLPFGLPFRGLERRSRSLGSGFIVDPTGLIVTNAHVVAGADDIRVRLADDREFDAKVIGKDSKLDLALLKLDNASGLAAAVMGDSDTLRVGDWVLAIGNPFGLGHTVTIGITSAKGRSIGAGPYDDFIQTDASINPGNSGGPLFNLKGEVVGIPTAIRQNAQGIGFAVPVNALKEVLPQLRDKGSVSRGKLGVRIQPLTSELAQGLGLEKPRGALVSNVEPNSAGAKAGIQPGDVITHVNGLEVNHADDLPRMVARHQPGTRIKITIFRGGKASQFEAVLDPLLDDPEEDPSPSGSSKPGPEPTSRLGIQIDDAPGGNGARVRFVSPTSLAAGQLLPGDIIIEINKQPVRNAAEAMKRTENIALGQVLLLKIRRGNDHRFVAIKVK